MDVHRGDDVEMVIHRHWEDWNLRNLFIFGIWEKAKGTYIGESYLANTDWNVPRIEVGYFIIQTNTRKGFATEAARAIVRFTFEHLGVIRVELQCKADNEASIRVVEHCGFVSEGRFRDRHRKKAGKIVDVLWYGMLLSDWQKSLAAKPPVE
jgi:RimJ/RimL family protein N-acetyltransferase